MDLDDKALKVLACDIGVRPANAADITAVLPYIRSKKVQNHTVIIDFEEAGKSVVQSFIDAERMCCSELTWSVTTIKGRLRLRIAGTSEQAAVVSRWFDK